MISIRKKNTKEFIVIFLFNLDPDGFLIAINTIIVNQNIANITQPVTRA